ncbi:VOC family protein [Mesorhizobium kowhaii]|nr:VOC family protein [Mesorhizobium kowhaii]
MNGINHLVLAAHDLDALRSAYSELGFTLTPRGQHPFGTGNSIIQLHGNYLELLSVTIPQDVVEHGEGKFSFSAFNRDYLARHEGFSMTVLDTSDAAADRAAWMAEGLRTYQPFEFSRMAKMPTGEDVRVGFSLAFLSTPAAPWFGHFACQHFRPEYYAQPQYLGHANSAQTVRDVWLSGKDALELAEHMRAFTGVAAEKGSAGSIVFNTLTGAIILASPQAFEDAFGMSPPHPDDGPHLAGLTIRCRTLETFIDLGLPWAGSRLVLSPTRGFGTAVAFST